MMCRASPRDNVRRVGRLFAKWLTPTAPLFIVLAAAAAVRAEDTAKVPDDAEIQVLAKKLGQSFQGLQATFHHGPAQDSDVRVTVNGVKAEPVGGEMPGAKVRLNLHVMEMQLQGGDFADSNYAVDIDLKRDGDKWTCARAMATPGLVSTKFGPVVGGPRAEPINLTAAVQQALVKIGAADSPVVTLKANVVRWVTDHNALGADSPIGEDMGKIAEKSLAAGQNFGILLGPGLMKSGRATRVGVFGGQFYTVEYTADQAQQAGLQPHTVVPTTARSDGTRRIPPDVEIGQPSFGAGALDLGAGIRGAVPVRATRRLPQADYVIRLSYSAGGQNLSNCHHLGGWLLEKEKPVEFKFGPATGEAAKHTGPLVVFLDVCEMTPDGNGGLTVEVISATKALVVDVRPGAAKP